MKKYLLFTIFLICPILTHASSFVEFSEFDIVQSEIKYSLVNNNITEQQFLASDDIIYSEGSGSQNTNTYKSPGKAFAMSLILPGWGQHYTGASKLKSIAFLGAEVTSWYLYFKWDKDADNLTDAYEDFSNAHWIKSRYQDMLQWRYSDRDANPGKYPELSHHLPNTTTQQYYEMTGKYDQFAWGWDDAVLLSDGTIFEDYSEDGLQFQQVFGDGVPFSSNRKLYETMRDDANDKYNQARKMIYVSMLNRMISAFEAMLSAKRNNNNENSLLSNLSAETTFKSIYVKGDTPYLTLSKKF